MKKPRRILYIGQLWEGGTCRERMRILQEFGNEILPFDVTPWVRGGNRMLRSLAHRTNCGPPVRRFNEALLSFALLQSEVTHVWVDKGRWVYPEVLMEIKRRTGAQLIHYTPDPQLLHHRSRHFNACIPLYDLLVTTKQFEVNLYKSLKAKEVMLVLQGYDDRCIPRIASQESLTELGAEVTFIGHCEQHYARRLRSANLATSRLRIWGPGWRQYARFHPWAKPSVMGDGIWGEGYTRALTFSKIALGLLSKRIPETTTTRSFEIPALGVFMLAERTDDHQALFDEGVEAEFFGSEQELKDKITFYLKHDGARAKIASAGRERCLRSGYHSREQLKRVIERVA